MDAQFLTAPDDVTCPAWAQIDADLWVNVEPLRDAATGGYARLHYRGALAAADAIGAELPTAADLDALRDASIVLTPVILPDAEMLRAAGIDSRNQAAVNAFRSAHMMGVAWREVHDRVVQEQLDTIGWDGVRPVSNVGKCWIAGASPGRARLKGWAMPGGKWIQSGVYPAGAREFHSDDYSDYSSCTHLVRRTAP